MSWYEKSDITNSKIGDIILSYDLNKEIIVEAELYDRVEEVHSENVNKIRLVLEDREIELTVYHIIPYYSGEDLIEDNCGMVTVGDELLCIDAEELVVTKEKVIETESILVEKTILSHPKSSNGYYFVNGILLHD